MKKLITMCALMLASTSAFAQGYTYEDALNGVPLPSGVGASGSGGVEGGLTVFTDRMMFEEAAPGATNTEDFETNNAGGAFQACVTPVNSSSDNNCFTPGQFVDGMDLNTSSGGDAVMLPPGFRPGLADFVMGAITFADTTFIDFSGDDVTAVGMDVYAGLGAGDVVLTFRNEGGGTIGTTTVMGLGSLPDNEFVGVIANEPIAQIEINGLGDNGELVDNVAFGPSGLALDQARFLVSKDFNDDNPAEVQVTLSCNTGIPLEQTTTISEGDAVNFVIGDFEQGALNCTVTEGGLDGYTTTYFDGTNDSCEWEDLTGAQYSCQITNSLDLSQVEVGKVWIDDNPQFNAINVAEAEWSCSPVPFGDDSGYLNFIGNPAEDGFGVYPYWNGGTTCNVIEVSLPDGGVETDGSDCLGLLLLPGDNISCTIYNTRLYEGIPTLSHYGLAVLALMMLGVGMIGFRRFV